VEFGFPILPYGLIEQLLKIQVQKNPGSGPFKKHFDLKSEIDGAIKDPNRITCPL